MISPDDPKLIPIAIAATLALAAAIGILTLAPISGIQSPGSDKLHHVLAFAALAFPLPAMRPRMAIRVVLGVIIYGGFIELIQPLFGRSAEWADLLADGLGAAIGAGAGLATGKIWRRLATR